MTTLQHMTLPLLLGAALCSAQTKPALQAKAPGPSKITLEQAGSRTGRDRVPAYEGKDVVVTGQVSTKPIWITDSYYVAIQDSAYFGLLLRPEIPQLPELTPGDWVEAEGTISKRAGLPILLPRTVHRVAPRGRARTPSGHTGGAGVFSLHGRAGDAAEHHYGREPERRRGSPSDRPAQRRIERVPAQNAARLRPETERLPRWAIASASPVSPANTARCRLTTDTSRS